MLQQQGKPWRSRLLGACSSLHDRRTWIEIDRAEVLLLIEAKNVRTVEAQASPSVPQAPCRVPSRRDGI